MKIETFCFLKAIADWIGIALLTPVVIFCTRSPLPRLIDLSDVSITQEYIAEEKIPILNLFVLVALYSAIVLSIMIVVNPGLKERNIWWTMHFTLLGLAHSIYLSVCFIQTAQSIVGRPRPDFIDRCILSKVPANHFKTAAWMDIPLLNEGRRSFPSEHAAISSAALGFLGLMLASSNVFSGSKVGGIPGTDLEKGIKRTESQLSQTLWKLLFVISLVFGWSMASWLVWFKVIENRNHPTDIMGGVFFGTFGAYITFRLVKWHNGPWSLEWYKTHRWDGIRKIK